MPAKRKTRSPRQEKVSVSPDEKKARNNSEESNNSPGIIFDALDMAESVSQKLDCIMQSLEKLNRIESRLDSMASTMANIESNISRLDADVRRLQQESKANETNIKELEESINFTEEDITALQKSAYDHKAELEKCKKDLLYLEAYSRRENVKIFGAPEGTSTSNVNASEPEDTRSVINNFLENELRIENPRARYELQRVHRLGKPKSTSPRPIIVRFLRFTDKEEVIFFFFFIFFIYFFFFAI